MSPETRVAVEVDGRTLSLTNLDKVLYPETGFTKGEVLDYYTRIAPLLLPHIQDRPMTFVRFPDGVGAGSFFEKDVARHAPDWVRLAPLAFNNASMVAAWPRPSGAELTVLWPPGAVRTGRGSLWVSLRITPAPAALRKMTARTATSQAQAGRRRAGAVPGSSTSYGPAGQGPCGVACCGSVQAPGGAAPYPGALP